MIDAHFHAWQLSRGDYGWLTPALAPIYRDIQIADWTEHATQHHITGGVLVQAAPTFEETQYLLAQADQNPMVKGVVGWIDMLTEDAVDKVALCAKSPLLKGLRPMLQDIADPDWILQAQVQPVLSAMAAHGLVLDALIKPIHLPQILEVTRAHPALKVVIDHGAKPLIDESEMSRWEHSMTNLAQATDTQRVMCKLSGLWTEAPSGNPIESIQPWCEALLEIWTPHRLIWGSDWPVLELAGSYSAWRKFSQQLISRCSASEQALIFGENAKRIYQL
jgi:L-fuconolactonase